MINASDEPALAEQSAFNVVYAFKICVCMKTANIFSKIEQIVTLLRAEEHRSCKTLGLHVVHLQILRYLSICNKYSNTPASISDYLGITRGPISQTLIYMTKIGLIEKYTGFKDHRVVHVGITQRGSEILNLYDQNNIFSRASIFLKNDISLSLEALEEQLKALQKSSNLGVFGVCKTCQHFNKTINGGVCGLTTEDLNENDSEKICREYHFS